jgi:hypothetical protein
MLTHVRRAVPALLLAVVLSLSLSACGSKSGEDAAGGAGSAGGRTCEDTSRPGLTVLGGSEENGPNSVVNKARNTILLVGATRSGGSASCVLPEILDLLHAGDDHA